MKQHLLISLTAAVILAVVLCTAGCVSSADEIVGNWLEKTDGAVTYAVFAEDGTGFFAADEDSVLTLEWKANGDTTYTFIFADGTTKTGTLNAEHGLMTMGDGSVLEKQPSGLSGATKVVTQEDIDKQLMERVRKIQEEQVREMQEERSQKPPEYIIDDVLITDS